MFDPERDDDKGNRNFYGRIVVVALVGVAMAFALWPSIRGFTAGEDHQTLCVALRDGWHADNNTAAAERVLNTAPHGPEAAIREWEARPDVQAAIASIDATNGRGACVNESRHRLILSGIGLGAIAIVATIVTVRRRQHRKRERTCVSSVRQDVPGSRRFGSEVS